MKKIVQIGGNLRINGISSYIMALYRNLHKSYQFIFINTAKGNDYYRDEVIALGGKIYDVVVKRKGLVRALRQAKEIRSIIRKERPIVVHSHYFSNNGLYLKQAYLENVPVRISHSHQSNPDKLTLGKRIAKWISKIMVNKYATRKLGCCDAARQFLYGDSGEVSYNAISYEKFTQKGEVDYSEFGLDSNKKYCLFIGRFSAQKNIAFLLQLFQELKENKELGLIMVGYGAEQSAIEQFIHENSLSNIALLPPDSDIVKLLSISFAFLLPSVYEGLPITLIEAQAIGTQCLVSDNVTKEVQLGLIDYLPLDIAVWKESILDLMHQAVHKEEKKSSLFDDKLQAEIFKGIYDGISSDDWIVWGKEYSIGSKTKYRSKYLSEACFEQAHRLGNVRGTFYYALGYFEGNGVEKDIAKAKVLVAPIVEIIERHQNRCEFAVILGDMYSFGLGKPNDYSKAYKLYSQAAQQGNTEAMCDLGYMYQVGQGVALDLERSAYWYKKSADMGYIHSMRDIGQSFLHGLGVEVNPKEAVKYFRLASDNNYSHGTCDLAYCYLFGIGIDKDERKAAELYIQGLRQDDERTMRDLFALGLDVAALKASGIIKFTGKTEITESCDNNTYCGTVCVSPKINYVDPKCFYSCNIKKFFVENKNPKYCAIKGVLFNKDKTVLVRFAPQSTDSVYIVPDCVKEIGEYAFQNCRNLQEIRLPKNLQKISISSFDDCKALERISIPETVESIGAWAFHGCDSLKTISVPAKVKEIGRYAFGSCESLESITVDLNNPNYCSYNGNLYDKSITTLLQYAIGNRSETLCLPNSVTTIAFRAVSDAYHLKEVNLSNVVAVEEKAFYYATSLKTIRMNKGVQIGEKAFEHTSSEFIIEVAE